MNLVIDGYEANVPHRVGIGTYAYETLKGLHALIKKQKNNSTVTVFIPSIPLIDMPEVNERWNYVVQKPGKLWTFIGLPLAISTMRPSPDVIFSPTHYIPRFISIPRVMSIMDLSYLYFPEMFRQKDLHQLRHWTAYSVKHAAAILTISEYSKNAIIEQYKVQPEQVFVTYPGFRMNDNSTTDVQKQYGIQAPYILSVGTIQPRKNYVRLIEAFAKIKKMPGCKDLTLVIVGKKGWLYEHILSTPHILHIPEEVRFLDFVPDKHLPSLYKHAECFALPSLYEGFGLPVLEAMAYETTVVVSDVSSLPEIAGDAGIYVKPESVESIVEGLQQALSERRTEKEKKRLTLGKKRIALFSWEQAAKKTLEVIEKIATK